MSTPKKNIFDRLGDYWNGIVADKFKSVVVRISGVPKDAVDAAFKEAPALIERAASEEGTGWDRLKLVVEALMKFIPKDYSAIASTVLTIVVAGARLFELLKSKEGK